MVWMSQNEEGVREGRSKFPCLIQQMIPSLEESDQVNEWKVIQLKLFEGLHEDVSWREAKTFMEK
jgi:hypothetical protein